MIWTQKPDLKMIQKMCLGTMCETLDMVFTEAGDDYLIATMPVDERTKQPAGLLHGGASVALAESLGSIASALCLTSPQKMPVGIEINANHLKSATSGRVTGKVTPIRVGQSLHVWNIEIHNEKSELVCVSRLTVMIVDKK
ncbi:MAG: hotdog fold thioesterase [Bdellovibrionaceae bacterium]|nr:hotdog fold thioesterase [Pseudobdellovibrionaceae bacterium]